MTTMNLLVGKVEGKKWITIVIVIVAIYFNFIGDCVSNSRC